MQSRSLVLCVLVSCVAAEVTRRTDTTKDIEDLFHKHSKTEYDDYSTAHDFYLVREKCFNGTRPDDQQPTSEESNGTAPTVRLPLTGYRTRQEYRTLSVSQRKRFHKAMHELYKDGTFTCFAQVHKRGIELGGTHSGYAFLPWHRVFIALYEDAIRLKDPDVSLPYWDSSLDDNMANGAGYSVMWDHEHMGSGVGEVKEGPFAGWQTAKGPLTRNVARDGGALSRQDRINDLFTHCSYEEFSKSWETIHNSVHKWVGGTFCCSMAAFEPLFYMHHAFIDYIWEKFRQRQRTACGVDPTSDYPHAPVYSEEHAAEHYMFGINSFMNREGMADYWINNWYNYTESPTCANNCSDSSDLYCDKDINLCASQSLVNFGDDGMGTDGDDGIGTDGDAGIGTVGDGGIRTVGDDGIEAVGDDGIGTVGDDGIRTVGDDGIETVGDDGIGTVGDDGIRTVGDDGIGTVGDDGMGTDGDDGIGTAGDDGIETVGDDGIGTVGDHCIWTVGDNVIGTAVDDGIGTDAQLLGVPPPEVIAAREMTWDNSRRRRSQQMRGVTIICRTR